MYNKPGHDESGRLKIRNTKVVRDVVDILKRPRIGSQFDNLFLNDMSRKSNPAFWKVRKSCCKVSAWSAGSGFTKSSRFLDLSLT